MNIDEYEYNQISNDLIKEEESNMNYQNKLKNEIENKDQQINKVKNIKDNKIKLNYFLIPIIY